MKEFVVCGDTLPVAYHNALICLKDNGEYTDCSDWNTSQIETSITIQVENPLKEPMISGLFIGGPEELEQYVQEIVDGILDFEVEKGNWEYTYHDRMTHYSTWRGARNQLNFVVDELKRNPSSRRAVIDIRDNAKDMNSNEPACLQHIQYFIRDNRLHCKVLFRSNDACKATFMNMYALIRLQEKLSDELNVGMGTYSHRANSFHCYERDFDVLDKYVKLIEESSTSSARIFYDYTDDWQDIMEEARVKIAEKVKYLKDRE